MLHNFHKFAFVALLEPFQSVRSLNRYRRRLRMPMVTHNISGNIRVFDNHGYDVAVVKKQRAATHCSNA